MNEVAEIRAAWEKLGKIKLSPPYRSPMEKLLAEVKRLEEEAVETDKILAAEVENVRIGVAEEKRLSDLLYAAESKASLLVTWQRSGRLRRLWWAWRGAIPGP